MIDRSFIERQILTFGNLVTDCGSKKENVFLSLLSVVLAIKRRDEKKRKKNIGEQQETRFPWCTWDKHITYMQQHDKQLHGDTQTVVFFKVFFTYWHLFWFRLLKYIFYFCWIIFFLERKKQHSPISVRGTIQSEGYSVFQTFNTISRICIIYII